MPNVVFEVALPLPMLLGGWWISVEGATAHYFEERRVSAGNQGWFTLCGPCPGFMPTRRWRVWPDVGVVPLCEACKLQLLHQLDLLAKVRGPHKLYVAAPSNELALDDVLAPKRKRAQAGKTRKKGKH